MQQEAGAKPRLRRRSKQKIERGERMRGMEGERARRLLRCRVHRPHTRLGGGHKLRGEHRVPVRAAFVFSSCFVVVQRGMEGNERARSGLCVLCSYSLLDFSIRFLVLFCLYFCSPISRHPGYCILSFFRFTFSRGSTPQQRRTIGSALGTPRRTRAQPRRRRSRAPRCRRRRERAPPSSLRRPHWWARWR